MASIILLESDDLIDSFVKKFDHNKFNFILISSDIRTKHKYKNVFAIKQLLPPTKALAYMLNGNDKETYHKKYIQYLAKPNIEIFLTTIAKLAVVEDSNVVLVCSENEGEMKYLNVIKKYLEEIYAVKVFKYKEFKKNPKKCESTINKKKTVKIIGKKIDATASANVKIDLDPEDVKARLKHMDKDAVVRFAKDLGIKVKKDMSKGDIIKKIKKHI